MNAIALEEMAGIQGGASLIDKACVVIGAGSAIYTIGAVANWWNPVGWVLAAGDVASIACGVYEVATHV